MNSLPTTILLNKGLSSNSFLITSTVSFIDPFRRPVRPFSPVAPSAASLPGSTALAVWILKKITPIIAFLGQLGEFLLRCKDIKIITRWVSIHYTCFGDLRQSLSNALPAKLPSD